MSHSGRIVALVVVLGVALLATGCGSSSSGGAGSGGNADVPPSTTGAADGGPPPLPAGTPPPTPTLVPITPAPGRQERVAEWHLAGQADGGRQLLIDVTIGGPPCDTVTGLDVTETGTAVTITVHAGRLTGANCPSGTAGSLATARVVAELTRPLGDRELLGGIV